MPPIIRRVLPFVVINVVLVVVAIIMLVTGHHVVAIVLIVIDAANLMAMRWRMFQWYKERRRGGAGPT